MLNKWNFTDSQQSYGENDERVWESSGGFVFSVLGPIMDPSLTHTMMLLALPLEIWEMIFDFLPARDLQTTSKVESPFFPPEILAHSPRHL